MRPVGTTGRVQHYPYPPGADTLPRSRYLQSIYHQCAERVPTVNHPHCVPNLDQFFEDSCGWRLGAESGTLGRTRGKLPSSLSRSLPPHDTAEDSFW